MTLEICDSHGPEFWKVVEEPMWQHYELVAAEIAAQAQAKPRLEICGLVVHDPLEDVAKINTP